MKKILLAVFSVVLLFVAGCEKIEEITSKDITLTMAQVTFTIPATEDGQTINETVVYDLDINAEIKEHAGKKFGVKNIKSLTVSSCELKLINGTSENNFSALENLKIELSSNLNLTYTPIVELANNPDTEKHSITIPVNNGVDLTKYFSGNKFNIKLSGKTRKPITEEITCTATIEYDARVGL